MRTAMAQQPARSLRPHPAALAAAGMVVAPPKAAARAVKAKVTRTAQARSSQTPKVKTSNARPKAQSGGRTPSM